MTKKTRLSFKPGRGVSVVEHFDLQHPDRLYLPPVDLEVGFRAAFSHFCPTILGPDLEALMAWLLQHVYPVAGYALLEVWGPLAHECWSNGKPFITLQEMVAALMNAPGLPDAVKEMVREGPGLKGTRG